MKAVFLKTMFFNLECYNSHPSIFKSKAIKHDIYYVRVFKLNISLFKELSEIKTKSDDFLKPFPNQTVFHLF